MLHAAAMLTGSFLIWLALTQRADSPLALGAAALAALGAVLVAWRFGGLGGSFARMPQIAALSIARVGALMRGAFGVLRAAIAADVALQPALVRVKTRLVGAGARVALAELLSAAPGQVVVEADGDGLLLHVIDENAVDSAGLGALEARVVRAVGPEAPA